MLAYISFLSLLASSTLAIPHAYKHQSLHARGLDLSPVAGRSVSDTGVCGGDSGFQCAEGFCCSSWGYCGNTASYCGTGCQSGSCDAGSSSASATSGNYMTESTSSGTMNGTPKLADPIIVVSTSTQTTLATTAYTTPIFSSSSSAVSTYIAPTSSATSIPASPTSNPTSSFTSSSTSSSSSSSGSGQGLGNVYKKYSGDGSTNDGWPSMSDWASFDTLWSSNEPLISEACENNWQVPNNSDDETANLKSAIQSVASSTGVDSRFILAIIMQESKGCVRVPTTNYGVYNPGLMQSHAGAGSCNTNGGPASLGSNIQNPCPMSEIQQMVSDGVSGTTNDTNPAFDMAGGNGLAQYLNAITGNDASKYYQTAREYNSGSLPSSGNLISGGATNCYPSDIANRLTGWTTATDSCGN